MRIHVATMNNQLIKQDGKRPYENRQWMATINVAGCLYSMNNVMTADFAVVVDVVVDLVVWCCCCCCCWVSANMEPLIFVLPHWRKESKEEKRKESRKCPAFDFSGNEKRKRRDLIGPRTAFLGSCSSIFLFSLNWNTFYPYGVIWPNFICFDFSNSV